MSPAAEKYFLPAGAVSPKYRLALSDVQRDLAHELEI